MFENSHGKFPHIIHCSDISYTKWQKKKRFATSFCMILLNIQQLKSTCSLWKTWQFLYQSVTAFCGTLQYIRSQSSIYIRSICVINPVVAKLQSRRSSHQLQVLGNVIKESVIRTQSPALPQHSPVVQTQSNLITVSRGIGLCVKLFILISAGWYQSVRHAASLPPISCCDTPPNLLPSLRINKKRF